MVANQALTLHDLENRFGLYETQDAHFFWEWVDDLPALTETETIALDRLKANFLAQKWGRILLEELVKMIVISPLLDLAGFYQDPFQMEVEEPVNFSIEDEDGTLFRGRIDILVLQRQLWLLVIEAKRTEFSLDVAFQQALTYMWGNPKPEGITYGMVTNGSHFRFLKLNKSASPCYSFSDEFTLNKRDQNDLYRVLSILKRIGSVITAN